MLRSRRAPPRQPDKSGFEVAQTAAHQRCRGKPNQYAQFMDLLQDYTQAGMPVTYVAVRVASMFAADPDLIERFLLFLPEVSKRSFLA